MAAREYVEWIAYQAIEDAAVDHEERHVYRRSTTMVDSPHTHHPHGLTKSSSVSAGFGAESTDSDADLLRREVQQKLHISRTCVDLQNGAGSNSDDLPNGTHQDHRALVNPNHGGLMGHMKKRFSNNFEHYSNMFHEVALPILFRKGRSRSSSRDNKREHREHARNASPHTIMNGDGPIENDFEMVENIELHHMDGFVFSSQHEIGKGHNFVLVHLRSPSWCDKCGDFIWGVYKQCLKCTNCEYTCHHKCRQAVTLDCANVTPVDGRQERPSRKRETSLSKEHTAQAMICSQSTVWFFKRTPSRRNWLLDLWGSKSSSSSRSQSDEDDADSGYHTGSSTLQSRGGATKLVKKEPGEWTLTREDLRRSIQVFNNNNHGLIMSLQQDANTFQGFIRVHMNLIRPINMSLSTRPPSIYDVMGGEEDEEEVELEGEVEQDIGGSEVDQITSFYLPKDTTKVIHINSDTTAQEVIQALLSKFKITDNPRKFALYEQMYQGNDTTMRRLEDSEVPLPLCLLWTKEGVDGLDDRRFVLQENDTGEIMWEAFSLPELENFLKILNREEDEYMEQVRNKYRMLKIHMERRLKELGPSETTLSGDKRTPVFV